MTAIKTPCIGICSTSIGDSVCRGCKRFNHEVFQWNGYTPGEKSNVIARLQSLLGQTVDRYLAVIDETRLELALHHYKLERHPAGTPETKAYLIIRALTQNNNDLPQQGKPTQEMIGKLGLSLKPTCDDLGIDALFARIDGEYHQLSLAYYDANFLRAYRTGDRP